MIAKPSVILKKPLIHVFRKMYIEDHTNNILVVICDNNDVYLFFNIFFSEHTRVWS